jgi:hypothetical protein
MIRLQVEPLFWFWSEIVINYLETLII